MSTATSNICLILAAGAAVSFGIATGKASVGAGVYACCVFFYNIMDEVCKAIQASK